ncbi:MAG: acetyltransferase [Flavobacterium sp.]|nr:acetyltransferase [Flavobacterium sp.]
MDKVKKVIIFGKGELAELANFYFTNDSNYEVCAFTLDKEYIDSDSYLSLPVLAFDELEINYPPQEYELFVAIGYSNLNQNRKSKYEQAKSKGYTLASYVSSKSSSWPGLQVGENTFIMEDNTIMPFCKIGNNVLVWVNSILAHHMVVMDHVTITSHCAIGGNVIIEEQVFIGLNASIRNNVTIGKGAIIGASANVVKNVENYAVMMGNPAKHTGANSKDIKL